MTYQELIETIENKRRFGKASGYEVSCRMLELLSHPEDEKKVIHIAGTNGKGSTAAFISSILRAAGFCVGTFTSPHLVEFTERITVNGEMIPKDKVVVYGENVLALEPTLISEGLAPTMFDICLGIAIQYFLEMKCDYIVLETGLGGRMDSTRALSVVPRVSVFTNIGFDHTAYLGNTLEAIAGEKAGILKPGTYAVIGPMASSAKDVIACSCKELDISYVDVSDRSWQESHQEYFQMELGLQGNYQKENCMTALAAIFELMKIDADVFLQQYMKLIKGDETEPCVSGCDGKCASCKSEAKLNFSEWKKRMISVGLKNTRWPGRMEVISKEPYVILDGAHNPQGVEALKRSLMEMFPGEKFVFIMGVMADKDYATMVDDILPLAQKFYTVSVGSERSLSACALAEVLKSKRVDVLAANDFEEAFTLAKQQIINEKNSTSLTKRIVIFGSLYFVGEVKRYMKKERTNE